MRSEITENDILFNLFVLDFRVLTASKADSGLVADWEEEATRARRALTRDDSDDNRSFPAPKRARIDDHATSRNLHHSRPVVAVVATSAVSKSRSSKTPVPSTGPIYSEVHESGRLEGEDDSAEYEATRLSPVKGATRVSNRVGG
jgi:hypothetical protein